MDSALRKKWNLDALDATSGQRLSAAKLLGIGKTTLYSKLKQYGIEEVAEKTAG